MTRIVGTLFMVLTGLMIAGLSYGDYPIPLDQLIKTILRMPDAPAYLDMIVFDLRMPRLLLSMLVGAALAVAGAITQAIMRNPLAEPGLLGINAGAALAVMLVIVAFKNAPVSLLPWAGFLGAGAMAMMIYLLSWRNGTASLRIILIGIGLSSLAGAASTVLSTYGAITDVQRALIWLSGSVYHADWTYVRTLALWLVGPVTLTLFSLRQLDLICFGDAVAHGLGQRVNLVRVLMISLCTLISGAAVAAAGLIGFVGLIAPHIARRLVGPGHRRILPVSALIGAVLVMAADLLGRTVIAPSQLPAGLVTALIGAPFFGYLLWKHRHVPA
ncbi:FecCD family ABC transporter permease [Roseibium algae]|uniref:Iron ABC transporter permease n=1 Tax=Roseibium algae TaxID=3123038 RepID=A0ABU8TR01_9HYPH